MTRFLEVSQATAADLSVLVPLFDAYRQFYGQTADPAGAEQYLFERFAHLESVIFLARDANTGEALGFAQLYPAFSSISMKRTWILNDLFVGESYRQQGVAKRLLTEAIAYGQLTRAKGIELSTAKTNAGAKRLYEQLGFERDETYDHYFLTI
ncbi:GNAT family N-acetyltransferase [Cohnella nanjingensis]|uniref:GNAT family N-acetyltransferase n=1 Tax=Cohnella nanjingensis TaxID=1387779 RepID=A0A7X0RSD6_9BACL|nr:GNAT family N-acetyltransferase [Cohnella nanjingensis]MBB6672797.1 GNAT family N-acetyltransferase [Cohnella nanjingensis]